MAAVTATFETGTNTNTIATGDTGSANAWDVVSIGSSATAIYDTTHVYQTLAARFTTPVGATTSYCQWSSGTLGSITDAYGRAYLYLSGLPGTSYQFAIFRSTGTVRAQIGLDTSGHIVLKGPSATLYTGTTPVSTGAFVRVEWHAIFSNTVGRFEAKLFNSPDSTSVTETIGDTVTNVSLGGSSANEALFGIASTTGSKTLWMDNIVWNNTSYPGPFAITTNETLTTDVLVAGVTLPRAISKTLTT